MVISFTKSPKRYWDVIFAIKQHHQNLRLNCFQIQQNELYLYQAITSNLLLFKPPSYCVKFQKETFYVLSGLHLSVTEDQIFYLNLIYYYLHLISLNRLILLPRLAQKFLAVVYYSQFLFSVQYHPGYCLASHLKFLPCLLNLLELLLWLEQI